MPYSPAILALIVAFPVLGPGGNVAGTHSAAVSAAVPKIEAEAIQPAVAAHAASAGAEATTRVNDEPPARTDPQCAELDKRKQLRGRLDQSIVKAARSFLRHPLGAGSFVSIDGRRYAFCVERHYHPPGFTRGPEGWHNGVTVYDAG